MRFVAGKLNGKYLLEVHENAIRGADAVYVAVVYAAGEARIIDDCHSKGIPLVFYGRYDESVPIALPILKRFLDAKSPNLVCKLVPDIFHPKVIWWRGKGVYIGSANLTNNGWFGNIEAGLYMSESELVEQELVEELEDFFEEVDKRSHPFSREIYEELKNFEERRNEASGNLTFVEKQLHEKRLLKPLAPLTYVSKKVVQDNRKRAFLREWSATLQTLRDIGDRVSEDDHRPSWISREVPRGVQVDQFLHAFYYSKVRDGNRSRHYELHGQNKSDPERALVNAMEWWSSLANPPHGEDTIIRVWAPFLYEHLKKDRILSLGVDEFIKVCERIHALRDHALRVRKVTLGLPIDSDAMRGDDRRPLLARWIYSQRSPSGKTILEKIGFVLYGGPSRDLPERIWLATHSPDWSIPHFGISTIGELTGWALPNDFPPRNGRTSKELTALGFLVVVHSG